MGFYYLNFGIECDFKCEYCIHHSQNCTKCKGEYRNIESDC